MENHSDILLAFVINSLNLLFWIDAHTEVIMQSNLDGSQQIRLSMEYPCSSIALCIKLLHSLVLCLHSTNYNMHNTFNADGIAVDWISDKLYYHNWCHDNIGVLDLTTNLYKTIVIHSGVGYYGYFYTDIVVDPTTRLDYS